MVHHSSHLANANSTEPVVNQGKGFVLNVDFAAHLLLDGRNHVFSDLEDFKLVSELLELLFSLPDLNILVFGKFLLVINLFLDLLQQQVDGLALISLDFFDLRKEAVDVLWRGDLHKEALALAEKILKLAL